MNKSQVTAAQQKILDGAADDTALIGVSLAYAIEHVDDVLKYVRGTNEYPKDYPQDGEILKTELTRLLIRQATVIGMIEAMVPSPKSESAQPELPFPTPASPEPADSAMGGNQK